MVAPRPAAPVLAIVLVVAAGPAAGAMPVDAVPWSEMEKLFVPPAEQRGRLGGLRSVLLRDDGTPVTARQDWPRRRQEIVKAWQDILGAWPPLLERPRLRRLEAKRVEGFTRHKVQVEFAADRFAGTQYLLVPDGAGPFPAVLVTWYNAEDSAGLAEQARGTVDFGLQLAGRGFVTLCIGGEAAVLSPESLPAAERQRGLQPLSALAYAAVNCAEALAALPEVDARRIGIVGHSFGGKWAMVASCLHERFACAVWCDPGIVWNEKDPNANYWERWYLGYQLDQADDRQRRTAPSTGRP